MASNNGAEEAVSEEAPPTYSETLRDDEAESKKTEEDAWAVVLDAAGGQAGGQLFTSDYLGNPIVGLIVGILVTVLVQSSSTSSSIITTMVGAGIIDVHDAIPIIMGANIGTSVTNTIVSLTQSMDTNQFRRAFAGATVHDMFNFLCVIVLLPLEVLTGYLEAITTAILSGSQLQQGTGGPELLDAVTDPLTEHVIRVNKSIITLTAQEIPIEEDASMILTWCQTGSGYINKTYPEGSKECEAINITSQNCTLEEKVQVGIRSCTIKDFLFANTGMADPAVGTILLVISLVVLCACLIFMVKLLSSMLKGSAARVIKKVLNTNFKYPFGWVSGYLAIIAGALLTFLFQSSSVFTSTMTPLVGLGVISLKRMYPLTLGSNIGTTATSLLAALATESEEGMLNALQISLCHFFFNVSGILIWYPVPIMRRVPIRAAMTMGNTTAKYKWFAVLYLIFAFFLIPGLLLLLNYAGPWVMGGFLILVAVIIFFVIVVNVLQSRKPEWLPEKMRTWDFLPLPLHSLKPYDKVFSKALLCCKCCKENEGDESETSSQLQSSLESSFAQDGDKNRMADTDDINEKVALSGAGKENQAFHCEIEISQL